MRPISARPGQIRKIAMPGPSDYRVVNTNLFLARNNVIPNGSFNQDKRDLSVDHTRSKSPGPNHYRVTSSFLKRSPSATIGN
jgi:hypothetical protein